MQIFSKQNGDPSLRQGSKFKQYRNDYTHIVGLKKLNLIEQTTMPNLENMTTMKESDKDVLSTLNTSIDSHMKTLEMDFNDTLDQYSTAYDAYMKQILQEDSTIQKYKNKYIENKDGKFFYVNRFGVTRGFSSPAWASRGAGCPSSDIIPDSVNAYNALQHGLDYVPGQPCNLDGNVVRAPDGTVAWIDDKGYRHVIPSTDDLDKAVKEGTCPATITDVEQTTFDMFTEGHDTYTCNVGQVKDALYTKVIALNEKLLSIAGEMYKEAVKVEQTSEAVEKKDSAIETTVGEQMQLLEKHRRQLEKMNKNQSTLQAELTNTHLAYKSEYWKYVMYLVGAGILTSMFFRQLTR